MSTQRHLCHSPLIAQKRGLRQRNQSAPRSREGMRQSPGERDPGVGPRETQPQGAKGRGGWGYPGKMPGMQSDRRGPWECRKTPWLRVFTEPRAEAAAGKSAVGERTRRPPSCKHGVCCFLSVASLPWAGPRRSAVESAIQFGLCQLHKWCSSEGMLC